MKKLFEKFKNLSPEIKVYVSYLAFIFGLSVVLRIIFNLWNFQNLSNVPFEVIAKAFYLGMKFDLRVSQVLVLPLFIFIFIPKVNFLQSKFLKNCVSLLINIVFLVFVLTYVNDFGFYSYLGARLNASVIKFFETPLISLNMVWESYPVIWIVLGIMALLYGHHKLLKTIFHQGEISNQNLTWSKKVIPLISCFLFFAISIYGKFSWYPLRWSEAYFSPEPMASKLAVNPIHHFVDTYKYKDKKDYDENETKKYYEIAADYLGVENKNKEGLNFLREFKKKDSAFKNFNVVFVMMESLSHNKTSLSPNPLNPTPFLKQLAAESVYFSKHFTPTVATARGVFASIISGPDMTPGKGSSSRNPFIVNQNSVLNEFKNHEKFYFLGGSANWGNIRGLFTNNIDGVKVYEEGSYSSPRVDVWGISDIDLFIEANNVLKKNKKPFFAFIQTASFHRPFTIPENNYGFEKIQVTKEELDKYGFDSLEEYNSMRFMDYSLQHYIKIAKEAGYYDNTLFVVYGDHGIPTQKSIHMPKGYIKHGLTDYHVPLLFHAPKVLSPKVENKIASQVDIAPTVVSLFGLPYKIKTLGRDLFDTQYDDRRYAFVYAWYANPLKFGLINNDYYYISDAGKGSIYKYQEENFFDDLSSTNVEEFTKMDNLAKSLLEYSRYIMYFNTLPNAGSETKKNESK